MDRAVDAAAAEQRAVRRVDDRIERKRRDVGNADIEPGGADLGGTQRRHIDHDARMVSRPLGLRFGPQIDRALHADIVKMLVEETPRRPLAVDAQHLEEIVVGRQLAGGVELLAEAIEHDAMDIDAAVLARPGAARQPPLIDQAGDKLDGAIFGDAATS